jgi:hypothetical protein
MVLSRRLSRFFVPLAVAGLSSACMGRVDPGTGDPPGSSSSSGSSSGASSGSVSSSGASSGSGSSSGASSSSSSGGPTSSSSSSGGPSPGDPDCSILAVPDLARVCPDGSSVGGQYVISNHQCVLEFPCPPSPPPIDECTQGGTCDFGSGCGGGGGSSGCSTSCMCDDTGHYQCSTSCPPPPIMDPCPGLAVPDICEVCSNGTTECAHAILLKGQCEVEICPGQ